MRYNVYDHADKSIIISVSGEVYFLRWHMNTANLWMKRIDLLYVYLPSSIEGHESVFKRTRQ